MQSLNDYVSMSEYVSMLDSFDLSQQTAKTKVFSDNGQHISGNFIV